MITKRESFVSPDPRNLTTLGWLSLCGTWRSDQKQKLSPLRLRSSTAGVDSFQQARAVDTTAGARRLQQEMCGALNPQP